MIVTNKRLSILAGVAAVMAIVTLLLYATSRGPRMRFEKGALLIQGLDLEKVAKITVTKHDKTLTLVRSGKGFAVAERNNYPAATKKVNELLIKCAEIRCAGKVTSDPDNYARLSVADDPHQLIEDAKKAIKEAKAGGAKEDDQAVKDAEKAIDDAKESTIVTLKDADGNALVGLLVGKYAAHGSGAYVRLAGQDSVYAAEKSLHLSTDPTSYMDTDILEVKKDDTKEVTVKLKDKPYTLTRDKDDKVVLKTIPKGKQPKKYELDSVFEALSSLSFDDVTPLASAGVKWDATYTCRVKTHMSYVAQLGKKDDDHYVKITAQPASESIRKKVAESFRKEDADKKERERIDAVLTTPKKAAEFNARHGAWAYEVSSWKAEKMRKPLSELIEDIPKPKEPEEIAASHILIAYKGAERADAKIKRSKKDAKKRAEEVLKKAKAKDADFAKLAKECSDGPSKTKGGDLGSFKKGKMHENFDEAVWKLKVDEFSSVVETPFGFHIIKRTK